MPLGHLTDLVPSRTTRTITFDGVNTGLIGAVPLFTCIGAVLVKSVLIRVLTALVGAGATLELGTVSTPAGIIGASDIAGFTLGALWNGTTPAVGVGSVAGEDLFVTENAIITVAGANITAGELECTVFYHPMPGALPAGSLT
jgi:hypothetical protein